MLGIIVVCIAVVTVFFYEKANVPSHVVLDIQVQQSVVSTLMKSKLSPDFAKSISESLPEKIGDYTLVKYSDFAKKTGATSGDSSVVAQSDEIDRPLLQTYDCLGNEDSCQEQVWASYENGARTTRVIFTHIANDKDATLHTLVPQVTKNYLGNYYVLKETYIMWLPQTKFDTLMTRTTPSDNGLEADTSASDAVTRYYLKAFPGK